MTLAVNHAALLSATVRRTPTLFVLIYQENVTEPRNPQRQVLKGAVTTEEAEEKVGRVRRSRGINQLTNPFTSNVVATLSVDDILLQEKQETDDNGTQTKHLRPSDGSD